MKDEKKTTVGRRDFLRKVGIGAVGAGAAVAAPLTGPRTPTAKASMRSGRRATR